jgi:hypothetical protein
MNKKVLEFLGKVKDKLFTTWGKLKWYQKLFVIAAIALTVWAIGFKSA